MSLPAAKHRALEDGLQIAEEDLVIRARSDIGAFFAYVMKDEETGAPCELQPFQREWHDLCDLYDRLVLWVFMEGGKTVGLSIARTLWELGRDPTLRFAVVSGTASKAAKIASSIAQYIEKSEELRRVFPELVPNERMPWNTQQLTVRRPGIAKDPSVQVVGEGTDIQGARLDRAILDDVLNRDNTRTPDQRDKMQNWYLKTFPGRITARGRVVCIGNAFHVDDLYHRLAKNSRFRAYKYPICHNNGTSLWPGRWTPARIEARRSELGRIEAKIQLDCDPIEMTGEGVFFRRGEVTIVDSLPEVPTWVRRWDLAATEPHDGNRDPDWTAGVKMGRLKDGRLIIGHVEMVRKRSDAVRKIILGYAMADGKACHVGIPEDPGQAGVAQANSYIRELAGYRVWAERETGDKVTRAEPFSAQWQRGNVLLLRGEWNDRYLDYMEAFPTKGVHDDVVDASCGAFRRLLSKVTVFSQFAKK
jgi:predicted phage terminase large subunit-like protein